MDILKISGAKESSDGTDNWNLGQQSRCEDSQGFAHTLSLLLDCLEIDSVVCVGISAAGRTALHFAKNYPAKVNRLILESAVTCEPWPDLRTKIGSIFAFNRFAERFTWAVFRQLARVAPNVFLKLLLPALSSLNPEQVINSWKKSGYDEVLKFLLASRSRAGFLLDIHHKFAFDDLKLVNVPTLIVASVYDKSVSPENSKKAAAQIKGSALMLVKAQSHLIWFSEYKAAIETKIADFIV